MVCLDVRAVERYDRLRWKTAGGEAGGQMGVAGVAVAEVDGRAVGLEEEVSDGITSIIDEYEGMSREKDEHGTHRG